MCARWQRVWVRRLRFQIPRRGRVLPRTVKNLYSSRENILRLPYGIERAAYHSNGEEVVSASVQSIARRLNRFAPDEFDMIVTDECHHTGAATLP